MRASVRGKVCVVGSSNVDLIAYCDTMPRRGETIEGSNFRMGFGGKGANQAAMAAKLAGRTPGSVIMVTKVGEDTFGRDTLKNYESLGISTKHVHTTNEASSGVAPIIVDKAGNNAIVIVPGANNLLTKDEIHAAIPDISHCTVMLCQLEIPIDITLEALRIAKQHRLTTILNPAPARPSLPDDLYKLSDIFCPNETETELLTGLKVETLQEAEKAARVLLARGCRTVVLTLGERGCLLVDSDTALHVQAVRVNAVDTTGAGDCFLGSLGYFLAQEVELKVALERACHVAAISVTRHGTQTSFPERAELPAEWF